MKAAIMVLLILGAQFAQAPVAHATDAALLTPPPSWQGRFEPMPRIDRGNVDVVTDTRLNELRARIAAALTSSTPAAPATDLIDALGELCAMYDAMGTRTSAQTCYENLRRVDPDEFRWPYQQAWMDLRSGRHEEALALLDQAAALRDDYPPLTLRRGEALYGLDRLDEATAALLPARDEPGLSARASYFLGQIALLRRDFAKARELFEHTLELAPQADAVHYPLAQTLRQLGDIEAAKAHLARRGKDLPEAADRYAQAVATAASGAKAHFYQGMQAKERSDLAAATEAFATGLALDPDNQAARISYARLLYLNGNPDGAREQLQRLVNDDHPSPLAAFLLGLLHDGDHDEDAAADLYRQALLSDPEMPGARHFLGQLLYRRGDYAGALPHLRFAADSDENNLPARILAWAARYRRGEPPATLIAELLAARDAQPREPTLRYALIRLLAVHGDAQEALTMANALVADLPSIPALKAALGAAQAANGDTDGAIGSFNAAAGAASWSGLPGWAGQLEHERDAVAAGQRLTDAWPTTDPLFQARPTDIERPFNAYPAGAAY
ncbi:MAG: tetratricopeptide repeat protein [Zoogloeaceae bacterium]|nr:tetratricopeptide repeat protein [Gammaproteobacteria bacterium]MCP5230720.1 tetratricopeptide repeat protein [Zoogloeaceae bacterium]